MKVLEWSDDMSCGVDYIDRKHQDLIDSLNTLFDLASEPEARDRANQELLSFMRKVGIVFKEEEAHLEAFNPDRYPAHSDLHDILMLQLNEIVDDATQADDTIFVSFIERCIAPWLAEHMVNIDSKINEGRTPISDRRHGERRAMETRRAGTDRRRSIAMVMMLSQLQQERRSGQQRRATERRTWSGRRVEERFFWI